MSPDDDRPKPFVEYLDRIPRREINGQERGGVYDCLKSALPDGILDLVAGVCISTFTVLTIAPDIGYTLWAVAVVGMFLGHFLVFFGTTRFNDRDYIARAQRKLPDYARTVSISVGAAFIIGALWLTVSDMGAVEGAINGFALFITVMVGLPYVLLGVFAFTSAYIE